ncbi:MAG: SEL1-like repeat protein, partial [Selenomonadaceae bacterium]|nr:SEL1-like repeat protein [Selenomonadaceae bacterium]
MKMQKGQRDKLDKYIDIQREFAVVLYVNGPATYDYTCFCVDGNDKLSDDRYMVFYNQLSSPQNEIVCSKIKDGSMFKVNLRILPTFIQKLIFAVSIDGNGTMKDISTHKMMMIQDKKPAIELQLSGKDFHNETAIISFELYKKSMWRFNIIASGYNGGLADLLKHYGGECAEEISAASIPQLSENQFHPFQTQSPESEQLSPNEQFVTGLKYSSYRLDKTGETNDEKAFYWFQKAAKQGHAAAQNMLGCAYRDGMGTVKNDNEAYHCFSKAASQGNVLAQHSLGICYLKGQDYKEAMKWFRKAAEAGSAEAMNKVGEMYEGGDGIEQDYKEAMKWFRKAAEAGSAEAMNKVGEMYED